MIYLDNSATTCLDERVLNEMLPWMRNQYGNASSIYAMGRMARVAVEEARSEIATLINAHPAEIVFTSGGTESNNTVLRSCIEESNLAEKLIVGCTEHHAVLEPAEYLASRGIPLELLKVDRFGCTDLEHLHSVDSSRTLVSVMHSNNETGVIQPLEKIRSILPNALLHTDAVQSFGKVEFDVAKLGIDFASFSAHKIHGPKGVGALFMRKGIDFKSHQLGGGQERNRRAGTEPVALIVGFSSAARYAIAEMENRTIHTRALISHARGLIEGSITNVRINTPGQNALPNILNVSFVDADKIDGEAILQRMDMLGVAVSNGSACVSGSLQPSHVLLAMGLPKEEASAAVRFSVSKDSTIDEVSNAVTLLSNVIRDLRG